MKVLALPRYSRSGASSRVRMYQYLPGMAQIGWQVDVVPLFDDLYLQDLYTRGRRSATRVLSAYTRRLIEILRNADEYDLAWLEKECWPWLPALVDPTLLGRRVKFLVDYDDAIFHGYDQHRSRLVRAVLGEKIDAVMERAALVVAGNRYLADRAVAAGARRVEVVPSVVDLARYPLCQRKSEQRFTVGWIGSPATQHYLAALLPMLANTLDHEHDRFVTIGARFSKPLFARHEMWDWDEATEVTALQKFDVGIMPLTDTPFERGKCGFKLIQYMACAVPVIASGVGVNRELVTEGENGFIADSPTDWANALTTLREAPELRSRMGQAGRTLVEQQYSLGVCSPRVQRLLREAAGLPCHDSEEPPA